VGLLTDKNLILQLRDKYKYQIFDSGNLNALALTTRPGEFRKFNIESETGIEEWVNTASLSLFDHFNKETELIADLARRAKVVAYLDKRQNVSNRIASQILASVLERVAPDYQEKRLSFFYVNTGDKEMETRKKFGVRSGKLPALMIVSPGGRSF